MINFARCRNVDWVTTDCGWKNIRDDCDQDQVVTGLSNEQGNRNEFNVRCCNVSTIQVSVKIRF